MNRRIKALNTLHQVEERALEALSRDLSTAQKARAGSEARIAELGQRAATEAQCLSVEALPYVGRFMATIRREQAREAANCKALETQIEGLRDKVFTHFTAGRNWETLSKDLTREIISARERQSESALEDITSARFKR